MMNTTFARKMIAHVYPLFGVNNHLCSKLLNLKTSPKVNLKSGAFVPELSKQTGAQHGYKHSLNPMTSMVMQSLKLKGEDTSSHFVSFGTLPLQSEIETTNNIYDLRSS